MIEFKVYPTKTRRHYYKVCLFNTTKEMHEWNIKDGYEGIKKYLALTRSHQVINGKTGRTTMNVGVISFTLDSFRGGIVSHECCHATLYYFDEHRRKQLENILERKNDEDFAWTLGYMVAQMWHKWNELVDKKKIIPKK